MIPPSIPPPPPSWQPPPVPPPQGAALPLPEPPRKPFSCILRGILAVPMACAGMLGGAYVCHLMFPSSRGGAWFLMALVGLFTYWDGLGDEWRAYKRAVARVKRGLPAYSPLPAVVVVEAEESDRKWKSRWRVVAVLFPFGVLGALALSFFVWHFGEDEKSRVLAAGSSDSLAVACAAAIGIEIRPGSRVVDTRGFDLELRRKMFFWGLGGFAGGLAIGAVMLSMRKGRGV